MKTNDTTISLIELAAKFGVSSDTVRAWRKDASFPERAWSRDRATGELRFDLARVVAWLKSRPAPKRARPAKWRAALGLPQYAKDERKAARARERAA